MHAEALAFIQGTCYRFRGPRDRLRVLEIGSLDVNGGLRHLYPRAEKWLGLDFMPGPGVDVVADASNWLSQERFDLVICAEVLEHAPDWAPIVFNAAYALAPLGALVLTAACDPRAQHGAYDPDGTHGTLPGEHYENVDPAYLLTLLRAARFQHVELTVDAVRGDVYAVAWDRDCP